MGKIKNIHNIKFTIIIFALFLLFIILLSFFSSAQQQLPDEKLTDLPQIITEEALTQEEPLYKTTTPIEEPLTSELKTDSENNNTNHLGSTTLVTDEAGNIVDNVFYLPFGDVISGGESERYTYTGQEFDSETGLLDYGARQYNSDVGQFIQPDPVISEVYNPQSLNRYSYVLNNPYKYVDPDGKFILPAVVILASVWAIDVGVGLFKGLSEGKGLSQAYAEGAQVAGDDFGNAATTAEGAGTFVLNFAGAEVAVKILGKIGKTEGKFREGDRLRGSANPDTKATIEYGQQQHESFYSMESEASSTAVTNKQIPGTNIRPDSYDPIAGTVTELKPSSSSAINKGIQQLKDYTSSLEKFYRKTFEPILKTYTSYKNKKGGK